MILYIQKFSSFLELDIDFLYESGFNGAERQ